MKNAAIYIRVSTQSQQTDRQQTELLAFADKEGYHVTHIYKDVMSGFKNEEFRKELHQLKEDAKEKRIDIILFSEFSRLSRNVIDLNVNIDYFRNLGVELFFQKQNLWVKSKGDLGTEILLQVLAVVSRYEIELFAERSISGKIEKIKSKGINAGGLTPYGYITNKETKQLIINKEESKIIQQVFQMYADGAKQQNICDYLNQNNIHCPYAKRLVESNQKRKLKGLEEKEYNTYDIDTLVWTASSLNKILHNELYTGKRKFKFHKPNVDKTNEKEIMTEFTIEDEDLRIISDDLYNEVQNLIDKNRTNKDTAYAKPTLLKRFLKCGHCGHNYLSQRKNEDYNYTCYKSIKDKKTRETLCRDSYNILQSKLDAIVIDCVLNKILTFKALAENSGDKERFEQIIKTDLSIIEIKQKELRGLDEKYYKYYDNAIERDIPMERVDAYKSKIEESKKNIQIEINKIQNEISSYKKQIQLIDNSKNINLDLFKSYLEPENHYMIKQLLNDYIEKILLHSVGDKKGLIHIFYKNGIEEMVMIKNSRPRNEDYLKNYIHTILNEEEYAEFVSYANISDDSIVYPYLQLYKPDVYDKRIEYNKERKMFIDEGVEYTANEMYKKYLPKNIDNLHFYTKFNYLENYNKNNH